MGSLIMGITLEIVGNSQSHTAIHYLHHTLNWDFFLIAHVVYMYMYTCLVYTWFGFSSSEFTCTMHIHVHVQVFIVHNRERNTRENNLQFRVCVDMCLHSI